LVSRLPATVLAGRLDFHQLINWFDTAASPQHSTETFDMTAKLLRRATLAAVLSLAAAGASAANLTWSANLDALSMDPHSTNNSFTHSFVENIYEALTRFNDKMQIEPALATSWKPMGPTVWRFTLRQGVKFHNGDNFDADDVVFSWKRVNTPGAILKGNLSDLKDVRKVDQYTVDVETVRPLPTLAN